MKTNLLSRAQVLDARYLSILDMSQYNTDVPVTNAVYRITLPNFNKYVDVSYTPNTMTNIGTNLMLLSSTPNQADLPAIPSGLYKIEQSICPNDKLFFKYNFFNIFNELSCIAELVCEYENDLNTLEKLLALKDQFELAKMLAESCAKEKEAIYLFNIAYKTLAMLKSNCETC